MTPATGAASGPTFLVGPARSGTSLLYKLLCLHPDAAYMSNYVRRVPALPELAVLNRLARRLPDRRHAAWFGGDGNAYVYGRRRSRLDWAFPGPVEGEPVFRHCGLVEYDDETPLPPAEQARRLRATFDRLLRAGGGRQVVNKRIANNRRIPELLEAFPQARFVSLVRDGRDVALSLSKVDWWADGRVWFYGGTPRQWAAEGRNPWELCARNWVEELDAVETGLGHVPSEQVLAVRYEDVVAAPHRQLRRIAEFAGLAPSIEWDRGLDRMSFPSEGERWRKAFDAETLALVEAVQGTHLRKLGYLT